MEKEAQRLPSRACRRARDCPPHTLHSWAKGGMGSLDFPLGQQFSAGLQHAEAHCGAARILKLVQYLTI